MPFELKSCEEPFQIAAIKRVIVIFLTLEEIHRLKPRLIQHIVSGPPQVSLLVLRIRNVF